MPGAHDGHDFLRRFDVDIAAAAGRSEVAAVFSHGAAIRVWTAARAHNVPPTFASENELDNTGVVELTGSPEEGWTLLSWAGLPVGGMALADLSAADPLGEPLAEV
jgi:probable phosphoglycerate mutase